MKFYIYSDGPHTQLFQTQLCDTQLFRRRGTLRCRRGTWWQRVWQLLTSTYRLCGRHDTYGTHLALLALGRSWWPGVPWHFAWQDGTWWHRRTFCVAGGGTWWHRRTWHLVGVALGWAGSGGPVTRGTTALCVQAWHLQHWAASGGLYTWWHLVMSTYLFLRPGGGAWWHRRTWHLVGVALGWAGSGGALGRLAWQAWTFRVAGVALGDIDVPFVWQGWHLWHRAWSPSHPGHHSTLRAGVALTALGWLLWPLYLPRHVVWPGMRLVTSTYLLCGRRGSWFGDIDIPLLWQLWQLQRWAGSGGVLGHLVALGRLRRHGTLRGRLGTWWHRRAFCVVGVGLAALALVARLFSFSRQWRRSTLRGRRGAWWHRRPLCMAGVAVGGIDLVSMWQAWHFWHRNPFTHNAVTHTHTSLSRTTLSHTTLSHTNTQPTPKTLYTQHCHTHTHIRTQLFHTHTQLCHTHTTLSHKHHPLLKMYFRGGEVGVNKYIYRSPRIWFPRTPPKYIIWPVGAR